VDGKEHGIVGGVGLMGIHLDESSMSHRDEVGYWVGESHWGKGIMTKCLLKFMDMAFEYFDLVRIDAQVYAHNDASIKVLETCGFKHEATIEKAFSKEGKLIDGLLFVRFADD